MAGVLEREHSLTHGPVVQPVGDLIRLIGEQGHSSMQITLIADVSYGDIAAKDTPPSITFEYIAVLDRVEIDDGIESIIDFGKR